MSCGCNGYCNNQDCSGHIATCSNSYSFSTTFTGTIIDNAHLLQLQLAVNGAYSRRGYGDPGWPGSWPPAVGTSFNVERYIAVKDNINFLSGGLVTEVFTPGNIIYGSESTALQDDSNTVRNECICDYNCTCNINCSCNVNCVCDYP
jgi:hypothetical protein